MNPIQNLKKQNFLVLIPVLCMSLVAFVLALIAILTYAGNCASEFNGGRVSVNVTGFGIPAIILAGMAVLVDIAALFLARSKKLASIFALSRIANYLAFMLLLAAFLYQILDEYSLLGTILYPIFSGAVGDPVDPALTSSYFLSLILALVASLLSFAAGITMRKMSYRIEREPQEIQEGKVHE